VVRIEMSPEGHVRVVGALELALVGKLIEKSAGRELTLDLSQIYTADGAAVRLLANLPPGRVSIVAAPPWLTVWIAHERRRRIATPSRIHDDLDPSDPEAIGKSLRIPAKERGHGDCPEGTPNDKEDSK